MPEAGYTGSRAMIAKLVALVLLCLITGTAMAQQAKVTSLCRKILQMARKF